MWGFVCKQRFNDPVGCVARVTQGADCVAISQAEQTQRLTGQRSRLRWAVVVCTRVSARGDEWILYFLQTSHAGIIEELDICVALSPARQP